MKYFMRRTTLAGLVILSVCTTRLAADEPGPVQKSFQKHLQDNQYSKAIKVLENRARSFWGKHAYDYGMLEIIADWYAAIGEPDKTRDIYLSLANELRKRRSPINGDGFPRYNSAIAEAYAFNGQYEKSLIYFQEAAEQYGRHPSHPNGLLATIERARCELALGRIGEARKTIESSFGPKTAWKNRADRVLKMIINLQINSPKSLLELAEHFQGRLDGTVPQRPDAAIAFAKRVMAHPKCTDTQKRLAEKEIQTARRTILEQPGYPTTYWREFEAKPFAGLCIEAQKLEKEQRLPEALVKYQAYRPELGCGLAVAAAIETNHADMARVLDRLGRTEESAATWALSMRSGHPASVYQFALYTNQRMDYRRKALDQVKNAKLSKWVKSIEQLEIAVKAKDTKRVLSLVESAGQGMVVDALIRIGRPAVPELIREIDAIKDRATKSQVAAVKAAGFIGDPVSARSLWKAQRADRKCGARNAFNQLGRKAVSQQLVGWLDSNDFEEVLAALNHVMITPNAAHWKTRLD